MPAFRLTPIHGDRKAIAYAVGQRFLGTSKLERYVLNYSLPRGGSSSSKIYASHRW